jgi:DNA repair photolyase
MSMKLVANPPNPFLSECREWLEEPPPVQVHVYEERAKTILSDNDSPDIPFHWSINPYRGCQHACAYCYARPYHEYLGFGAGTDFDTKVVVKLRAPELLRQAFGRRSWKGEPVAFAGATDAWQPLEASYRLTRGCLLVCAEHRNPVTIVTKAALVERDLDVLQRLRREAGCTVAISIPWLDEAVSRRLEPLAPSPARRLATLARLVEAGLEPAVLVAPTVPGLDHELPRVLAAARAVGVTRAGWQLLRLPGSVGAVFEERLRQALPDRAERILHLVRETRGGAIDDPRFGKRFRGQGHYAGAIDALFRSACRRHGMNAAPPDGQPLRADASPGTFRRPAGSQRSLFPEE